MMTNIIVNNKKKIFILKKLCYEIIHFNAECIVQWFLCSIE